MMHMNIVYPTIKVRLIPASPNSFRFSRTVVVRFRHMRAHIHTHTHKHAHTVLVSEMMVNVAETHMFIPRVHGTAAAVPVAATLGK